MSYLMPSPSLLKKNPQWYYLTHSWEDKGVHTFPKGISPKVNIIVQQEFELGTIPQSSSLTISPRGHVLYVKYWFLKLILKWFQVLMPNTNWAIDEINSSIDI